MPALLACGDDDRGTGTAADPAWDIAFAGEIGGTTVLLRARGAALAVQRIGLGYPGMGAASDAAGARILYASLGNSIDPPRLMLLDGAEAEPLPFTDDDGVYEREPAWSPAGDRVAYTSHRDDDFGDVLVSAVSGGTITSTTNLTGANGGAGSPDMTPAWSPDGMHVAFTSYRGGRPSIWIMNANGGDPRQLTTPVDAGDYFPTWSPAGDSIAFQRIGSAGSRIGLVASAGGTPRFLTLPGDAFSPSWAPDAARLAITMRVSGTDLDVHIVGTDGTIVDRIRRDGRDYQPRWIASTSRF